MHRFIIFLSLLMIALPLLAQLDSVVDHYYEEFSETPGAVIAVYKDGEISFVKSYGIANMNHKVPITSGTVFDVGSIAKQFTAACIFLLEQQGKLSLEDPIQRFLPEMPVYDGDTVRIRHLIHHISGLRDYAEIMGYAGTPFNNYFTEKMGLDIMSRQQGPNFKPGERFMYNNGGYLLLAVIVRRASGMSIGEFAAQQIFKPLGMESTFILEDPQKVIPHGATGYTRSREGFFQELHHKNFAVGGDGQLHTTVEDLLLWDQNFYNPQVGGAGLITRLHERGVLSNGDTLDYAGGLFIEEYKGYRVVQHTGAWGGFVSAFYRLPELHATLAILSNYRLTGSLARIYAILDELLPNSQGGVQEVKTIDDQPTKEDLKKYEGLFEIDGEAHKRFETYVENDTLKVNLNWSKQTIALIPIAEGLFQHPQLSFMKYNFNQKDNAPTIQQFMGELTSHRVRPFTEQAPLEPYTGFYFSKEAEVGYTVTIKGKQLLVKRNDEELYLLDQVNTDLFGQNNLGLQFERVDGKPAGFLLQDRRIKNLKFERVD